CLLVRFCRVPTPRDGHCAHTGGDISRSNNNLSLSAHGRRLPFGFGAPLRHHWHPCRLPWLSFVARRIFGGIRRNDFAYGYAGRIGRTGMAVFFSSARAVFHASRGSRRWLPLGIPSCERGLARINRPYGGSGMDQPALGGGRSRCDLLGCAAPLSIAPRCRLGQHAPGRDVIASAPHLDDQLCDDRAFDAKSSMALAFFAGRQDWTCCSVRCGISRHRLASADFPPRIRLSVHHPAVDIGAAAVGPHLSLHLRSHLPVLDRLLANRAHVARPIACGFGRCWAILFSGSRCVSFGKLPLDGCRSNADKYFTIDLLAKSDSPAAIGCRLSCGSRRQRNCL